MNIAFLEECVLLGYFDVAPWNTMLLGVSKISESAHSGYFPSATKPPLSWLYEWFSDRKIIGGDEREEKGQEPPFPLSLHLRCKCYYSTHTKERNMCLCISDTGSTLEQLKEEQEEPFVFISMAQPCGAAAQGPGVFEGDGSRDSAWMGLGCLSALLRALRLCTTALPWCCHWICVSEGWHPPSSCHRRCVAFFGMVCSAILSSPETCLCKTNLALL